MENQQLRTRKIRVKKLIAELKKLFPNAGMVLNYNNNFELLAAVILSAQCTDKRVNLVTEKLFKKYKTLDDYIRVSQEEFEQDIFQTGFYRNKAKNIRAAAKLIKEKHGGKIPKTMDEMLQIPGAARKTANVVLGNAYNVVEGIAVDTHVRRFAIKFDLTDYKDPKRIEQDLMRIIPKKDWLLATYLFIEYGREFCPARRHDCEDHPLTKIYPQAMEIWPKSK